MTFRTPLADEALQSAVLDHKFFLSSRGIHTYKADIGFYGILRLQYLTRKCPTSSITLFPVLKRHIRRDTATAKRSALAIESNAPVKVIAPPLEPLHPHLLMALDSDRHSIQTSSNHLAP